MKPLPTKLTLGARLGLGFAAVLLLMTGMAGFATHALQQIVSLQARADEGDARYRLARQWEAEVRFNLLRTLAIAKSGQHAELTDYLKPQIKQGSARISELQKQLEQTRSAEAEATLMASVADKRAAYVSTRDGLFAAMSSGGSVAAEVDARLLPASDAYLQAVNALAEQVADRSAEDSAALRSQAQRTQTLLLVLSAAALATGALMAWLITRSLTRPIHAAVTVAQRVAGGDLATDLVPDRRDELGDLQQALAHMQAQLRSIIGQVRESSESIATGSGQIAAGNINLSQRTEEQAANLQQTAASMEELTVTVQANADTARTANQLAAGAREVARQGGEVVGQVVATMAQIAASSHRIGDIVGVIDGIAFQTNLLALNAAVEAARAGQQGRGFAVVAGEVRTLAQRSAAAATEIRGLIGDSVQTVDGGTALVQDAGRTMAQIVAQVQRVSDLIGEISVAGAEQSQGITQVGQAMQQLEQVTQQNAALVEESAAAADSLSQQAERLAQTVARFRLDKSGPVMTR